MAKLSLLVASAVLATVYLVYAAEGRKTKTIDYRSDAACNSNNSYHNSTGGKNKRGSIRKVHEGKTKCACHEAAWTRCVSTSKAPKNLVNDDAQPEGLSYEAYKECSARNSFHGKRGGRGGKRRELLTSNGINGQGSCVCHESGWTRCVYPEGPAATGAPATTAAPGATAAPVSTESPGASGAPDTTAAALAPTEGPVSASTEGAPSTTASAPTEATTTQATSTDGENEITDEDE